MTVIPFTYYVKYSIDERTILLEWVRSHDGDIIREKNERLPFLGRIVAIQFVDDENALLFKLKFGV